VRLPPRSQRKAFEAQIALLFARSRNGGGAARQPLGPVRFIDPSDSTGFADDNNTGATANNVPPGSGPILTTVHLNDLFNRSFLTGDRSILYMSDDPGSQGLHFSGLDLGVFDLTIQGTPQVTHAGGTLNAGTTTINPAAGGGGQRQTAHTTDLATFNPFLFSRLTGGTSTDGQRLVDLATGAGAWIGSGGPTASLSRPVDPLGNAGAVTSGDAYRIQRGSRLKLSQQATFLSSGGNVTLQDFAFPADSIGVAAVTGFAANATQYARCSFAGPLVVGGTFSDCFFGDGGQGPFIANVSAGLWVPDSGTDQVTGALNLSGDVYITGDEMIWGGTFYAQVFVQPGIGAGIQVQDCVDLQVSFGAITGIEGLIWGNGNTSGGITVTGGNLQVPVSPVPTVTGAGYDFAFRQPGGIVSVARPWDDAADGYATLRATTWANFAAAIGAGGFAFQAHDPATNASIVGV
jgi:hypothetical protein